MRLVKIGVRRLPTRWRSRVGVMDCERKNCEHIMCDRLILDNTQYICPSCWAELLIAKDTWDKKMSAADVRRSIERFMRSDPGEYLEVDTDEEFRKLTEEPGEL